MMLDLAGRRGVLPNQYLRQAIEAGMIHAGEYRIPPENIQPASLDLRLGEIAYRVRCSFLPGDQPVRRRMKDLIIDELNLHSEGVVLETGRPYLIPLKEKVALPASVRGRTNPKSSTGRADVFTRVITDNGHRFDEIAPGYEGQLWLEVVPLSFPIRVREDLTLNQLRLTVGATALTDDDVRAFHLRDPLLFQESQPVAPDRLSLSNGMFLGLDLRGDKAGRVGYSARPSAPLLDMTKLAATDPEPYWDEVRREEGDRIVLTPNQFYLLMSSEGARVPPQLAAEMTAYDPTSGELRTHYAGFFDPGFGHDREGRWHGSIAALEVRAHGVAFLVEHGQQVCKLTFEWMLEEPTELYGSGIGSNYQGQRSALGKHFLRERQPGTPEATTLKPDAASIRTGQPALPFADEDERS